MYYDGFDDVIHEKPFLRFSSISLTPSTPPHLLPIHHPLDLYLVSPSPELNVFVLSLPYSVLKNSILFEDW